MARIEKSIEVDAPLHTVYNQWTQFEEFPRFMEGVVKVQQLDDTHLRWHASVGGVDKQWDAEITEQVPDRRIAWRSVGGARNEGRVEFRSLSDGRTFLWLTLDYDPAGFVENVGDALGIMSRRVQGDLDRFKRFIEARGRETGQWRGEVHRDEAGSGQPGPGAHSAGGQASPDESSRGRTSGRPFNARPFWPEPFDRLRRMAHEMDSLFDRLTGTAGRSMGGDRGGAEAMRGAMQDIWTPQIEVMQRGEEMQIRADVPGIRREDVHVDVDEGRVVIQGERRTSRTVGGEGESEVQRSECFYGRFYREIPLPRGADMEGAQATLRDGVLEIRIRVPSRRQGRRIDIRSGDASTREDSGVAQPMAGERAGVVAGASSSGEAASSGRENMREDMPRSGTQAGGQGDWHLGR
jgi:HSP20 family molecular chaperone IbpA